jgi:hypothetical protein
MDTEKGIVEEVTEAITDNKESIDKKVPGSPFALVALSYFVILITFCLSAGAFLWLR